MDTNIYLCDICGCAYIVEPTGNHEEWAVSAYPAPQLKSAMELQPPTFEQQVDYMLTGEIKQDWLPVIAPLVWVEAATEPFCPTLDCGGTLKESYVVQL